MARLADAFGETTKDRFDKRMAVYFQALTARLDDEQLGATIGFLIEQGERFPTIKTILDAAKGFARKPIARQWAQGNCAPCGGRGLLTALRRYGQADLEYTFRCPTCDSTGLTGLPVWGPHFKQEGFRLRYAMEWDIDDPAMVKGLAIIGPGSTPWKLAPPEMRAAAMKLIPNLTEHDRQIGKAVA